MTTILFIVNCLAFAAGQLLLKRAMTPHNVPAQGLPSWAYLGAGIAGLAVSFFLSLGLLQRFELSFFFPLQGANVIAVVVGAMLVLRERPSRALIAGAALVAIGIALVSISG